jgi:hypothetical protein
VLVIATATTAVGRTGPGRKLRRSVAARELDRVGAADLGYHRKVERSAATFVSLARSGGDANDPHQLDRSLVD